MFSLDVNKINDSINDSVPINNIRALFLNKLINVEFLKK